ncbi:hypothetical protein AS9A_4194 [Hoyosella subflava DQS3-9A1]|uniref:Uncharacterized protein n=1 Tax=Hoyosella subflava (strain DSM 45089 / JCM 17490 / NBRC 109087 / DQS3-9A1) TaxID=443218 RepID=F6EK86_HOYSD|nr:hypothetical protein AS9A_4194 [Hoyosella subflava DQS3-9A1]
MTTLPDSSRRWGSIVTIRAPRITFVTAIVMNLVMLYYTLVTFPQESLIAAYRATPTPS